MLRTIYAIKSDKRPVFSQLENEAITYTINYAGLLDTDTISTSTWTAETTGLTIASTANTTTTATARLSGTSGEYLATNKIVTAAGDTRQQQVLIRVVDNQEAFISDYQ